MAFDGVRSFWEKWEQTILTFLAIVIVGVSSYLFGLSHSVGSDRSLEITTTEGRNTVLCSAQCETLGIGVDTDDVSSGVVSAAKGGDGQGELSPEGESDCLFVGSVNGSKYYPLDCKAINRINKENLRCFSSASEAKELGYALTKAC